MGLLWTEVEQWVHNHEIHLSWYALHAAEGAGLMSDGPAFRILNDVVNTLNQ